MKHKNYKLTDNNNGLIYVGASEDIKIRFESHITKARYDKKKKDYPLYVAMRGLTKQECRDRFIIEELGDCSCEGGSHNCSGEAKWIDELDATNPEVGYNISKTNGYVEGMGSMTRFKKGQSGSPRTQFKEGQVPTNKKTTPEQDQEIMEKWKNGQSIHSLSREYDIARTGIKSRIRKIS